jgi:mRNA-degrading endonuclease RelE of RelBE toxin-antitoxin system
MNELEKLFRKLTPAEQKKLAEYIQQLQSGVGNFDIKKIRGSEFFRARKGRFRFILHYTEGGEIRIDTIRLRDEKTYRDF